MSVRQAAYETSLQPMVPITGQSRLNVISTHSKYDTSFNFQPISPEDWEITWETGVLDTLIVEYKSNEDMNPDYSADVWYVEVYNLTKSLQPLFGTGNMDVDENYQPFGSYLGSTDSIKHLSGEMKDFHGQLVIPTTVCHCNVLACTCVFTV